MQSVLNILLFFHFIFFVYFKFGLLKYRKPFFKELSMIISLYIHTSRSLYEFLKNCQNYKCWAENKFFCYDIKKYLLMNVWIIYKVKLTTRNFSVKFLDVLFHLIFKRHKITNMKNTKAFYYQLFDTFKGTSLKKIFENIF